jgi:hypothetical protein
VIASHGGEGPPPTPFLSRRLATTSVAWVGGVTVSTLVLRQLFRLQAKAARRVIGKPLGEDAHMADKVYKKKYGDPIELLLLRPDGSGSVVVLGPDVLAGHELQVVVPAGTWMGARTAPGGEWSLFATTMAPGFLPVDYEPGDAAELEAGWPDHARLIRALTR